jgi:UDPglucose 6-dehydrogenase
VKVTVIGCGYLGATHAASMAELGYDVLGVEIDVQKRESLAAGKVPFYEPELEDLLAKHVASGKLRFTDSFEDAGGSRCPRRRRERPPPRRRARRTPDRR